MRWFFIKGFKEVFSKPFYILVALSGALLFYILNVIVSDFSELRSIANDYGSFTAIKLVFNYFIGFPSTLGFYSAFVIFIIALLFGSYIALVTFKTTQLKKVQDNLSLFGGIGLFFGFIAPGCFACGVGLASILGLGGALVALPFDGVEISVVSFVLLAYANISIAGKINNNVCPIKIYRGLG
ncbi:MAG: hypothetical protein AABX96_02275 [Nanoarchaeota archaeon]|mgnify:CR=1 FL=1